MKKTLFVLVIAGALVGAVAALADSPDTAPAAAPAAEAAEPTAAPTSETDRCPIEPTAAASVAGKTEPQRAWLDNGVPGNPCSTRWIVGGGCCQKSWGYAWREKEQINCTGVWIDTGATRCTGIPCG